MFIVAFPTTNRTLSALFPLFRVFFSRLPLAIRVHRPDPSSPFAAGRGSCSVFRISEMAYGCWITIFYRSCDWFLSGNLKRRSSWRNQWRGRYDRFFVRRAWINQLPYYVSRREARNLLVTNYIVSILYTTINTHFIPFYSYNNSL